LARVITVREGCVFDVLPRLPDAAYRCCVTSVPFWWQRDYGFGGQLGLEQTVGEYVANQVAVFRLAARCLTDDGSLWIEINDGYAGAATVNGGLDIGGGTPGRLTAPMTHGLGRKQMLGLPWRLALALQDDGWVLREDIVWHKPNGYAKAARDRFWRSHSYVFHLTKRRRYFFDASRRLDRSVFSIPTRRASAGAGHHAAFPPELPRRLIAATSEPGDAVLDPFAGTGTTGEAARALGRRATLVDGSPDYCAAMRERFGVSPSAPHDTPGGH
jgi:DNA modification methylase